MFYRNRLYLIKIQILFPFIRFLVQALAILCNVCPISFAPQMLHIMVRHSLVLKARIIAEKV